VLRSCSESWGTQAQLTGGKAAADRAVPAPKKTLSFFFRSSRSLPLTLFCRLPVEATENTFSSVKKTKSVAYCGNFWSRSLACFMRAASSTVRVYQRLCTAPLEIFQTQVFTNNPDRDDRWIPVSCDISRTFLWVCSLSSWLRTKSLLSQCFLQVRAKIDGKSK